MRPLVLLAALAVAGCASSTRTVDPANPAGANAHFAGRTVRVVLTDGAWHDADALRLGPDTTTWVDPGSRQWVAVPTAAVATVEHRDRRRAARRGVLRGVVLGSLVTVLAASLLEFGSGDGLLSGPPTAGGYAKAAGFGAAAGAAAGALGGALYDRPDRYCLVRSD